MNHQAQIAKLQQLTKADVTRRIPWNAILHLPPISIEVWTMVRGKLCAWSDEQTSLEQNKTRVLHAGANAQLQLLSENF